MLFPNEIIKKINFNFIRRQKKNRSEMKEGIHLKIFFHFPHCYSAQLPNAYFNFKIHRTVAVHYSFLFQQSCEIFPTNCTFIYTIHQKKKSNMVKMIIWINLLTFYSPSKRDNHFNHRYVMDNYHFYTRLKDYTILINNPYNYIINKI